MWTGRSTVRYSAELRCFSRLQNVQTVCRTHYYYCYIQCYNNCLNVFRGGWDDLFWKSKVCELLRIWGATDLEGPHFASANDQTCPKYFTSVKKKHLSFSCVWFDSSFSIVASVSRSAGNRLSLCLITKASDLMKCVEVMLRTLYS